MKINKVAGALKPFTPESVDVRQPLVKDLITAEVITGKSQGYLFLCCVISQCCTFDGQNVPPEDVERLGMIDFLELTGKLELNGPATLPIGSSTSPEKESSESQQ